MNNRRASDIKDPLKQRLIGYGILFAVGFCWVLLFSYIGGF
jgi:hypothetical protein